MLRISNHTTCRFRKKRGFSAHFGPNGAVPPPRVSHFSKVKRSGDQKKGETTLPGRNETARPRGYWTLLRQYGSRLSGAIWQTKAWFMLAAGTRLS